MTKIFTMRLPDTLAEDVEAIADMFKKPVSAFIRESLYEHILTLRADPEFQKRVQQSITDNQKILERLAGVKFQ